MSELKARRFKHPTWWVPSTFFMEGIPGIFIMVTVGIMYKNLGVPNEQITFYVGILTLPYAIRPLWAGFVDLFQTKSWWISFTEFVIGICFVALAFALKAPMFVPISFALCFVLAFMSCTHDMAVDGKYIIELSSQRQSLFLGVQGLGYQGGKIVAQGLLVVLSGYLFAKYNSYVIAWSIVLLIFAVVCILASAYHKLVLPKETKLVVRKSVKGTMQQFGKMYVKFFKLNGIYTGIVFLIVYKFGETMISGIFPLFLIDKIEKGGLGFSNQFAGLAYGTAAPIAILLAAVLGGYFIYRRGLKGALLPMVLIMNLPHVLYIYLAYFQPQNQLLVLAIIIIEQFCFSFGYTAYTFFLMYLVKDSAHKTTHYAFFSGVMMLGMMLPKMVSGWLQTMVGYEIFFIIIFLMIIPSVIVTLILKIDPAHGKKVKS